MGESVTGVGFLCDWLYWMVFDIVCGSTYRRRDWPHIGVLHGVSYLDFSFTAGSHLIEGLSLSMMADGFSLDIWMGDQLSVEPMITYTT